jgi:hypothetical protein
MNIPQDLVYKDLRIRTLYSMRLLRYSAYRTSRNRKIYKERPVYSWFRESVKSVFAIYTPVDGKIVEINDKIL